MGMIGNTLAQGLISGANIQDGTVDTPDLKDSAVTTAKVADGAVAAAKLAPTAVTDKLGYTPANAANLTNVENKSSATIRGELTSGNVTGALGYTPANSAGDAFGGKVTIAYSGMSAPSTTDIINTAGIAMTLGGGDYLTVGQYTNSKVWVQASYGLLAQSYPYNLVLQPLGGAVEMGGNAQVGGTLYLQGGRKNFFVWGEGTMNGNYVHLKTNRPTNEWQMHSVIFEGYDYGGQKPILCAIGWYNYGGSNAVIAIGTTGSHGGSVYKSTDGYAVMVLNASNYFVGFTLSQAWTNQGIGDITITAASSSASATGVY